MISVAYAHALFDYDAWAMARVLDTAEGLSPDELGRPLLAGQPPLLPTLVHVLAAAVIWGRRWEGESPTALIGVAEVPSLAALRERWSAEAAAWRARLDAIGDADMAAPLRYTTTRGQPRSTPRWQVVAHLVNHGTQHRAEAAAMLTALGRSPGDLDMSVYFSERG